MNGIFPFAQATCYDALEKLHIKYTCMVFLCPLCQDFIRPNDFLSHFKSRNHFYLITISMANWAILSNHILLTFVIPIGAVFSLPEEVTQPIKRLSFEPTHQCLESKCNYWMTIQKHLLAQMLQSLAWCTHIIHASYFSICYSAVLTGPQCNLCGPTLLSITECKGDGWSWLYFSTICIFSSGARMARIHLIAVPFWTWWRLLSLYRSSTSWMVISGRPTPYPLLSF